LQIGAANGGLDIRAHWAIANKDYVTLDALVTQSSHCLHEDEMCLPVVKLADANEFWFRWNWGDVVRDTVLVDAIMDDSDLGPQIWGSREHQLTATKRTGTDRKSGAA
jgi:hypothetical protein